MEGLVLTQTKYQVFISSTYTDLIKERKQVLDVLLMADCIPAGMESFVATDDEQFNVIKKVIDLCDYYILILGKRYGSINDATGLSYTEMEYNYAIEKEIPVLVFALDESAELESDKVETDDIARGKLAQFRIKAMNNRLANIWSNPTDLMGKVAISIMRAKSEISRPGWHRGSAVAQTQLMEELIVLRRENDDLKVKLQQYETAAPSKDLSELFYGKEIILHYTERVYIITDDYRIDKKTNTTTLDELFKFISLRLTGVKTENDLIDAINAFQPGYDVYAQDALKAKNKYEQLHLIESYVENNTEMIRLTEMGRQVMNKLNED